ncbi:MAG: hydrogenase maturation protease [Actinomycetota bacterium]
MIRVIACGNPDAGDDAVALAVAKDVRERLGASTTVEIVDVGPAINAVPAIESASAVVLIDAVRTRDGRPAGGIVRVEAGPDGLPVELGGRVSSHGFGVGEAVAVARALGCSAPIVVFGVEIGDVALGRDLSPAVRAAVPRVAELVLGEVLAFRPAA